MTLDFVMCLTRIVPEMYCLIFCHFCLPCCDLHLVAIPGVCTTVKPQFLTFFPALVEKVSSILTQQSTFTCYH